MKLKRYRVPLLPEDYAEFEQSRQVVTSPLTIDIVSGTVTGRPHIWLGADTPAADEWIRAQNRNYRGPVYVLWVPRDAVPRGELVASGGGWHLSRTLHVPRHCGVELVELPE
jgi:hypothetical protein